MVASGGVMYIVSWKCLHFAYHLSFELLNGIKRSNKQSMSQSSNSQRGKGTRQSGFEVFQVSGSASTIYRT